MTFLFLLLIILILIWINFIHVKVSKFTDSINQRMDKLEAEAQTRSFSRDSESQALAIREELVASQGVDIPDSGQKMNPPLPALANQATAPGRSLSQVIDWIKVDFMMKLGAFFLLLALGWFVSYAFANNWIGESGRIMLGLLVGAGIMAGGLWRLSSDTRQGGVLMVLGSATILITVYAAREIYDMFDPFSALLMMFSAVALVAFVSVKDNRRLLAVASLIMAGAAPYLTASPTPNITDLSFYLLVIVLGTLWVVYVRGWSVLTLIALVVVTIHHLPFIAFDLLKPADLSGLWFGFVFTLIFIASSLVGFMFKNNQTEYRARLYTALGSAVFLILWLVSTDPYWLSLALVVWAMVYATGGFLTYQFSNSRIPFYLYASTSLILIAMALASELSGPALTIAYTLKVVLLVYLAAFLLRDRALASGASFVMILPAIMSIPSLMSTAWRTGFMHSDAVVLGLLSIAMLTVAYVLLKNRDGKSGYETLFFSLASFYAVALVWLVTHAGIVDANSTRYEMATTMSLVIYTVAGIGAVLIGRDRLFRGLVMGGYVLIALVVARLMLVEVWNMEVFGKVITFMAVGVLLLSTAFIRRGAKKDDLI
jgi:uncharacterized membrane protein